MEILCVDWIDCDNKANNSTHVHALNCIPVGQGKLFLKDTSTKVRT